MAKQFPLNTTVCLDALNRPLVRGDFVVFNYRGIRRRGIVLYLHGSKPVLYILDVCVNRKWIDYREFCDTRRWRRYGDDSRRVVGTKGCVIQILPQHRLVPYKLKGLLANVAC